MNFFKKILIIIISIFSAAQIMAQDITAWSSLDSNAITIGDQINFKFGLTVPNNTTVAWPLLVDTLTANIEIINRSNIDTVFSGSSISLSQQFVVTSFDSGYFEIPSTNFKYRYSNDSAIFSASTGLIFLQVYAPEVDTSQAFKPLSGPIAEPYTFKELLPLILGATAILIVLGLLIFYLIKRKKKQPIFKSKPKPIIPAHIMAINKLEELRLTKVWQSGRLKKYYSELTDIIREYMVNRYNFDAPEMTSYEIITKLREFEINNEAMNKLEGVMNLSDMVKFAKAVPTALENDLGLTHCVDFVNETKKVADTVQIESIDDTKFKKS
jgi:hypothetical protein